MADAKFRSRVKTFTGAECINGVPQPWMDCWAEATYDRVVMIYDCAVVTQAGPTAQHWKAMVVFANANRVNKVLLVSDNEQLKTLWEEYPPNAYKCTLVGSSGRARAGKCDTVGAYLFDRAVYVSEKRLSERGSAPGITDWSRYDCDDAGANVLFASIEALIWISNYGALMKQQVHFFAGDPDEYEPNTPVPARLENDDHSAEVAEYQKKQRDRPAIWHQLWTGEIYQSYKPEMAKLNYNQVVWLKSCDFKAAQSECSEEMVWQDAFVFMHDYTIRNILLVSCAQLATTIQKSHAPTNFEFKYAGVAGQYQPLARYLEKGTDGRAVQQWSLGMQNAALRGARLALNDFEALNKFGVKLAQYIEDKFCGMSDQGQ